MLLIPWTVDKAIVKAILRVKALRQGNVET